MKGNEQVVAALNDSLRNAHSAFMQFAKHALWFQEKGYGKLAEMEAGEAAKEKAYMDRLAYRILFLQGDPDFGAMGQALFAADFRPILDADLGQQKASAETLRHAVKTANDVQDYASRDLANEILKAKEDRIDQIETEIEQFEAMGREVYLSTRVWELRAVAGAQSLLSVYLLAMWALTYFGRFFQ